MAKEKLLTILVITLVTLNIGLLAFMLIRKPGPPRQQQEVFQIIIEKLKLDDDQQRKFRKLREQHRASMDELDDHFQATVADYFHLLNQDKPNEQKRDSIEVILSGLEKDKARKTFDHFQELKLLLRSDQQEKFDELVPDLIRVLSSKKNPPPPRRD